LGYIFFVDSIGLTSMTVMELVPKSTKFGKIMQNNVQYTMQDH